MEKKKLKVNIVICLVIAERRRVKFLDVRSDSICIREMLISCPIRFMWKSLSEKPILHTNFLACLIQSTNHIQNQHKLMTRELLFF